jgi:hypothetical protein
VVRGVGREIARSEHVDVQDAEYSAHQPGLGLSQSRPQYSELCRFEVNRGGGGQNYS